MLALNTPNLRNTDYLFASRENTCSLFGPSGFRPEDCSQTPESSFCTEEMERRFPAVSRKLPKVERSQRGLPPAKSKSQTRCIRYGKFRKDSVQKKLPDPTFFFIIPVCETNISFCSCFLRRNFPREDAGIPSASRPIWIRLQVGFGELAAVCKNRIVGSDLPLAERESVQGPVFLEKKRNSRDPGARIAVPKNRRSAHVKVPFVG